MERRLLVAKQLLNPEDSILVVTIDEKEYLRLGLLLEQTFQDARLIQMVSSVINPKGTGRSTDFSRTDEYVYFVFIGGAQVSDKSGDGTETEVRWRYLRRTDIESARGTKKGGPAQFYPIYVNDQNGEIEAIGSPLPHDVDRKTAPGRPAVPRSFPFVMKMAAK
jgi:adenine-specific DNA-methyltransferase